jgi:hypothetical protein
MNKDWHNQNRMPRNASPKERIQWHIEHVKNCSCRPFPKELRSKLSEEEQRLLAKTRKLTK